MCNAPFPSPIPIPCLPRIPFPKTPRENPKSILRAPQHWSAQIPNLACVCSPQYDLVRRSWAVVHKIITYNLSQTELIHTQPITTPLSPHYPQLEISLLPSSSLSTDIPFLLSQYISESFTTTITSPSICFYVSWCCCGCRVC